MPLPSSRSAQVPLTISLLPFTSVAAGLLTVAYDNFGFALCLVPLDFVIKLKRENLGNATFKIKDILALPTSQVQQNYLISMC